MITLRDISKSFGAQTLLDNAFLQINHDDRFALVGPNGAGKSTLFKIIMGAEEPDDGDVTLKSGVRFGYLPQETPAHSNHSVLQETLHEDSSNLDEAKAKKILMGLGFKIKDFDRPINELSGGWQMRVMIARLLVQEPDLLMLDEPTNHLDLESLLWFQGHLQNYKGALFIISHDREFINSVTERIVELRDAKLNVYRGTFEEYEQKKKEELEQLIKAYNQQQNEIKQLEEYVSRFRAKASLAASVQSKVKYLEKMERIELPPEQKTIGFAFPQPARSGVNVLTLKGIRQSYDGVNWVYDGLDLTLERGQKIALVGPNGAGKSTLLKLLAGVLPFQEGEKKLGHLTEVGYFSQHRSEMFTPGRTVFQEAGDTRRPHGETTIRTVLGSFLFRDEAVFKKIEVLSGGEKSRLGLVKILLDPPNLILMDEPTTHLDISSVDTLVEALKAFQGTFCFISHDVYFIRQLADQIIHVNNGKVTWYPGNYDYFLHRKAQEEGEEAELFRSEKRIEEAHHHKPAGASAEPRSPEAEKPKGGGKKTKEQKRLEAEARNARYREAQKHTGTLSETQKLKNEEAEILKQMEDPATHQEPGKAGQLAKRLGEISKLLQNQ